MDARLRSLRLGYTPPVGYVFLSYASQDRKRIEPLVQALEASGHQVWWDRNVAQGQNFGAVIEEALDRAGCVIVVWTEASVESEWVGNEASSARKRGILVPVLLDAVEVPLEFRHLQLGSLIGWDGDASAQPFREMLASIDRHMKPAPAASVPTLRTIEPRVLPSRGLLSGWVGKTAVVGLLLLSIGVFLIGLKQVGLLGGARPGGSSEEPRASRGPEPATSYDTSPQDTNLLSAGNGGKLLQANQEAWREVVEPKLRTSIIDIAGFAIFGFAGDKPARFDTLAVYVESTDSHNAKQLALYASDESPTGPFRKLAEITLPNARNMQQPFHEFKVGPATARYVKLELQSWQSASGMPNGYLGNIQLLDRHR